MSKTLLPNLIIAGVPRAGTTSLFSYFAMHPDICASSNKETNYFLPCMHNHPIATIEEYSAFFSHCSRDVRYILEASPRYIYDGDSIPRRIAAELDSAKIIILLRDPVERLCSFYNHRVKSGKVPWDRSFEEHVTLAIDEFQKMPINENSNTGFVDKYDRGLAQGIYVHYLEQWFEIFGNDIRILFLEDLTESPVEFMSDLCNWLNIDPSPYYNRELKAENKSKSYKNKAFLEFARLINERFISKLGPIRNKVKKSLVMLHDKINATEKKGQPINAEMRKLLSEFYLPYNTQLKIFLNNKGYNQFPDWLSEN